MSIIMPTLTIDTGQEYLFNQHVWRNIMVQMPNNHDLLEMRLVSKAFSEAALLGIEELNLYRPSEELIERGREDEPYKKYNVIFRMKNLKKLDLRNNHFNNEWLQKIAMLVHLKVFSATSFALTSEGYSHLKDLEGLMLGRVAVEHIPGLAKANPKLRELTIAVDTGDAGKVTDAALEAIGNLRDLESLLFYAHGKFSGLDRLRIRPFAQLNKIKELNLSGLKVTLQDLTEVLPETGNLTSLNVNSSEVAGDLDELLTRYTPKLKELQVRDCALGNRNLEGLAKLPLEILYLGGTNVDDDFIPVLNQVHTLEELNLNGTAISLEGARQFTLENLEELRLIGTHVPESAEEELSNRFPHTIIYV